VPDGRPGRQRPPGRLAGLAPRVQAEVLFGLQERCRHGALTYLYQLRIFCRRLLAADASTIFSVDPSLRIPIESVHPFRSNPYSGSGVFVHLAGWL
jgi:hypothetical protein